MESRPNPTAAAPAAAPGKDTDPGSALPAGPARAAGGTGICSTATIGTRIISRSGAGSTSGIGTGTETGTGTTETGIWQEVVFNGLVSPHLDQDAVPEAALPHPGPFPTTPSPLRAGPLPAPRGLGNPPTAAAASRGHPAPLRGHSDPKRNGAFTPWREVCEPFPARGGETEGTERSPCSLGAWRCTAPDPGIRSHVPSSGLPGDTPVPIAPVGHCATLLLCPLALQELGKRGWSWAGGHPLLYPDIPHSSIPTQTAALASPAEPSLF